MIKLILIRHGESVWNKENKFTGWTDIELSDKGKEEAKTAGILLKENGFTFDICYTSVLKRAIDTLDIILNELGISPEIKRSYKLNERHYGALQGLNKDEMRAKYGEEKVHMWRRSVNEVPPLLDIDDDRCPYKDSRYSGISKELLPRAECLGDTIKRVVEYYESEIKKSLLEGKKVIVVAHGNSLRALSKYLDDLSDEEVVHLEIKTGSPICYELDDNLKPIKHYYLED